MAKFRKRMSRSKSKKNFRRSAGIHRKNELGMMVRGGIRL